MQNSKLERLLVDITISALANDTRTLRNSALAACRLLRRSNPEAADLIAAALANKDVGADPLRAAGFLTAPQDSDSRLSLAKVEYAHDSEDPVFPTGLLNRVERFVSQHVAADRLLAQGVEPPSTLLLVGDPGVGKTMLARYLARQTGRNLVVLDLATAVSSLLGKTGQNLKNLFEYARENRSVLLLDEFDSIAKMRNDPTDLGELKRIVNVLLKELEDWPCSSLLVAATNHPELLDRAVWRRFDDVIELPLPSEREREILVERNGFLIPPAFKKVLVDFTEGVSAAQLVALCKRLSRRIVLEEQVEPRGMVEELVVAVGAESKKHRSELCKLLKKHSPRLTYEEIASSVGISPSTVCYHLKGPSHGR